MEIAEVQTTQPEPPAFRAPWEIAARKDESRPVVPSNNKLVLVNFPKGSKLHLAGIVSKISKARTDHVLKQLLLCNPSQ